MEHEAPYGKFRNTNPHIESSHPPELSLTELLENNHRQIAEFEQLLCSLEGTANRVAYYSSNSTSAEVPPKQPESIIHTLNTANIRLREANNNLGNLVQFLSARL